jgi:hypothetical protein
MTKTDWELLPTPTNWKSLDGHHYKGLIFFGAILHVMGFSSAIFSLIGHWPLGFPILFLVIYLTPGSFVIVHTYRHARDGIETWIIELPADYRLFYAIDEKLEPILKSKGYALIKETAESDITDKETGQKLGRLLRIQGASKTIMTNPNGIPRDIALVFRYYFWITGKTSIIKFDFQLEGVTPENYQYALILQRDAFQVIKSLRSRKKRLPDHIHN